MGNQHLVVVAVGLFLCCIPFPYPSPCPPPSFGDWKRNRSIIESFFIYPYDVWEQMQHTPTQDIIRLPTLFVIRIKKQAIDSSHSRLYLLNRDRTVGGILLRATRFRGTISAPVVVFLSAAFLLTYLLTFQFLISLCCCRRVNGAENNCLRFIHKLLEGRTAEAPPPPQTTRSNGKVWVSLRNYYGWGNS